MTLTLQILNCCFFSIQQILEMNDASTSKSLRVRSALPEEAKLKEGREVVLGHMYCWVLSEQHKMKMISLTKQCSKGVSTQTYKTATDESESTLCPKQED